MTYDIDDKTKDIHVQNVIPDGPAEKAGLLNEDLITQINGQSVPELVNGKTPEAQTKIIQGLLRGEPGTKVTLTVDRAASPKRSRSPARAFTRPACLARLLPSGIGWVQLSVFGADTGHELDAALHRLDTQGAKAFILDLRSNGGGYLNAAVDVSSKFIPTGPIVTVESRAGTDTEYDAENTAIAPRPLAVLVNHYTASASEITAGAIQDSGVGEIIGTRTYGKGVVQSIFPLGDGSAVKITTARYLTPHGRDINSIGIQPEILSDLPKDTRIKAGDPSYGHSTRRRNHVLGIADRSPHFGDGNPVAAGAEHLTGAVGYRRRRFIARRRGRREKAPLRSRRTNRTPCRRCRAPRNRLRARVPPWRSNARPRAPRRNR